MDALPIASNRPAAAASGHNGAKLVLASSSPRRLDLLRQAGIEPDHVAPPTVDETARQDELPRVYAMRMALAKRDAVALAPDGSGCFVIGADTVVACGRRILPKTVTADQARRCLELLSGRRHRVYGGVAIAAPDGRRVQRVVMTHVTMRRLHAADRERYLASGDWHGKAGGYAIQGLAGALIPAITGSYSNVVGLPLVETLAMLQGLGWRPPEGPPWAPG